MKLSVRSEPIWDRGTGTAKGALHPQGGRLQGHPVPGAVPGFRMRERPDPAGGKLPVLRCSQHLTEGFSFCAKRLKPGHP